MNVLALNPGSSSLRFKLLRVEGEGEPEVLASGSVADLGQEAKARAGLGTQVQDVSGAEAKDHAQAAAWACGWIADEVGDAAPVDAAGVRVVQAGARTACALRVTPELERDLARMSASAPLHGAASLAVLRQARALLPGIPLAAVLDDAFHAGMPAVARTYGLPFELAERHGIRRFGFHGLALASVLEQLARRPGARPDERIVALHLGSGASATAIRAGRSEDTSMGFSPLEGLMGATRSGDLDPALVPHLARAEGMGAEEVVQLLNERSGLLGVAGGSADMRAIERRRSDGDPRAALAFDLFCYRAKKQLAAMIAVLAGVDAVAFSGGIGENSAAVRAAVCSGMEWAGLALDAALNAKPARDGSIGARGSRAGVYVVRADEERVIARETCALLDGGG